MKKGLLFLVLISVHFNSFAQTTFEKGYFINDLNEKIECLIKNIDWKNNPSDFEYKLIGSEAVQYGEIQFVKEFEINNTLKFVRATVQIDESNLNNLDEDRNPRFVTKQVFLKVLIEGKASLFSYENKSSKKYFYKINDSEIEQLIYKKYKIDNRISENTQFKDQLNSQLVCTSIKWEELKSLGYTQKDLESIFIKYNECVNSSFKQFGNSKRPKSFHLSIRPGLGTQNLTIENSNAAVENVDFGNKLGFRIGLEAEFILPFNNNKWGILIEPTFQKYYSEKNSRVGLSPDDNYVIVADYKSVELPIGFRYYLFLNDKSKFFINLSYITDFSSNSNIEFLRSDGAMIPPLKIKSGGNFGLGAGYQYNNKLNIELRYHTNREVLGGYQYWTSNYQSVNLILGYTLF